MAPLADFLRILFADGRVVLRDPPESPGPSQAEVLAVLSEAFEAHRLDVAGPPIAFDPAVAMGAASWLHRACWYLVDRSEPAEVMTKRLGLDKVPTTASEHLSADVAFRFLPQIRRRAMVTAPGDHLGAIIAQMLRLWPLSGVLGDLEGGPDDLGDLGGHPGLWLLYSERFVAHRRESWMPPPGPIRDRVVWLGHGLKARVAGGG